MHGPRRSDEPVSRRAGAAFTDQLLRTIGLSARRRAGRLAAHAAFWSGDPWTPRVAMGARCAFGPSVRFGAVALSAPCCFQPTEGGWVFGVFVCLGGTPPTSLHEEGASFQACAAMPQIPKPACFRCTVPVTLWMEPFRPLVQLSGLVPLRKQVVRHRTDHAAPWGGPLCVPKADRAAKQQLESGGSPQGRAPVNRVLASSQEHHFTNEIPKIPLEWLT